MNKHRPALSRHSVFIALADNKILMSSFQVILRFICSEATQGQRYEASSVHGLDITKHAFLLMILFFQKRLETFEKVPLLEFLTLSYEGGTGYAKIELWLNCVLIFGLESPALRSSGDKARQG